MDAKHTPGPWNVCEGDGMHVYYLNPAIEVGKVGEEVDDPTHDSILEERPLADAEEADPNYIGPPEQARTVIAAAEKGEHKAEPVLKDTDKEVSTVPWGRVRLYRYARQVWFASRNTILCPHTLVYPSKYALISALCSPGLEWVHTLDHLLGAVAATEKKAP